MIEPLFHGPFPEGDGRYSDDPEDWAGQHVNPWKVLEPEAPPKPYVPEVTPKCPRCQGSMALRSGTRGEFFGCKSYPACRGIVDKAEFLKQQAPKLPGV